MPRTNNGREGSSSGSTRRSRSSRSRSRSRHRDRRHHSRRRESRGRHKPRERNLGAAFCSMITIVIMSTSLAEPNWISLKGGGCVVDGDSLDHLGAFQFFYPGKFLQQIIEGESNKDIVYKFGPNDTDKMENCVNNKAVILLKTIIAFTFLAMMCTLFAFLLDLMGPTHRALKILRRNAIFSIVSVILCVIINLFCFWLTAEVTKIQNDTKFHVGSKVEVTFDVSFYLITAAGAMGIIATAMNCLQRQPSHDHMSEALLEDYDGNDLVFPGPPPDPQISPMANIPPPPAYTP